MWPMERLLLSLPCAVAHQLVVRAAKALPEPEYARRDARACNVGNFVVVYMDLKGSCKGI